MWHDSIAEAVIDSGPAERVLAAEHAVGLALFRRADDDTATVLRAARHLATAGEPPELSHLFYEYLIRCRRLGDQRPVRQIAKEVLGDHGDRDRVDKLVARLPRSVRLGLWSPRRRLAALAGVGLAAILGASMVARIAPDEPDAELLLWRTTGAHTIAVGTIPIREKGWRKGGTLSIPERWKTISDPEIKDPSLIAVDADGLSFIFSQGTDNENTTDVFAYRDDRIRRLTKELRDDGGAVLSPDGKWIEFLTARWSQAGADDYDVAIMDTAGRNVRPLTRSDDFDRELAPSPDGTRVGFLRAPRQGGPPRVCWVTIDGARTSCLPPREGLTGVPGWLDGSSILIHVTAGDRDSLLALNLADSTARLLQAGPFSQVKVSEDGAWIAVLEPQRPDGAASWFVFPTADPATRRPISAPTQGTAKLTWSRRWLRPRYLDTVLVSGPGRIGLAGQHRYRALGRGPKGDPIELPPQVLIWQSSDTAIAIIDSVSGEVYPRAPGRVTFSVSAGGWRATKIPVQVVGGEAALLLRESWDSISTTRWARFGSPQPRVDTGPDGIRGMLNDGDGSYVSGTYSVSDYGTTGGLSLETSVSTPITRVQSQQIHVGFASRRQRPVDDWDRVTTVFPVVDLFQGESCEFEYPGGDGQDLQQKGIGSGAGITRSFPVTPEQMTGTWYRIRVQILPDGRCAIAVNGSPVFVSKRSVPIDQRYRVWLYGNSRNTKILVGPLDLWHGAPTNIDWSSLKQ